jgi:uncharacterized protein (DUF2062 family)
MALTTNQGIPSNIRERRRLWNSGPSLLLAASPAVDIGIAATLAIMGIAMALVLALLVTGTLAAAALFVFVLDLIKVPVFVHLGIAQGAAIPDSETRSTAPELQGYVR